MKCVTIGWMCYKALKVVGNVIMSKEYEVIKHHLLKNNQLDTLLLTKTAVYLMRELVI
jgi:hypothetical protein